MMFLHRYILALVVTVIPSATADRSLMVEDTGVEGWILPPFPTLRFTDWDLLDTTLQSTVSDVLDYDDKSWNNPGTAEIEELSLETIATENPEAAIVIAENIGMDEEEWDCWINHYFDYDWNDLVVEDLAGYFEILGWTQDMWDNDSGTPDSDESEWQNLTPAEKDAATYICYFPDLWNMEDEIQEWTYEPPETTATTPPTSPPSTAATAATSSATSPPRVPQEAKVPPEAKCGSVAGDAGRGGSAAQAKGCGRLLFHKGNPPVRRIKGRTTRS